MFYACVAGKTLPTIKGADDMTSLKISDNRRYFVDQDGKPFIWLADTCWTMPQRLKWDDVDYYMQKRKQQGFTVLQIVALDPEQDKEIRNPAGDKALLDNDLSRPNELYFKYLDYILDKAESYGFHVLLLPVWGELVVGHNWMGEFSDNIVTEENAYAYGRWIGERYRDRSNIIWCLGGDRMPVHLETDYRNVWRLMAEGIAKGVLDCDLKYNVFDERWKKLLITYHACHEAETGECSTMSYWTDEEKWISFIMVQSGHGTEVKNYNLIEKEYGRENCMPVFDGEPAYEMMPTSWPVITDFHGDWMVRKRAYWSLFAGSFGHTYGHSSVWCMISEKERDAVRKYSWFEALAQPGAMQMKHLRDFMETIDLSICVPSQEILLNQMERDQDLLDEHRQACMERNGLFACVYLPSGGEERIDISRLDADILKIWWFCPKDGRYYTAGGEETQEPAQTVSLEAGHLNQGRILIKSPSRGSEHDWVCILQSNKAEMDIPGMPREYGETESKNELKKVFAW